METMAVAVVQVVNVITMNDGLVATAFAVNMLVVVMYLMCSHEAYGAPISA